MAQTGSNDEKILRSKISLDSPFKGSGLQYLKQQTFQQLKGQCHEIFGLNFFFINRTHLQSVPDKQAKMFFLKNSFSRRYLNLKFDSAQANTAPVHWFV